MKRRFVGVVDYGAGNLANIANCVASLGFKVRISNSAERLAACDALVLPGVGAFPGAMMSLKKGSLDYFIVQAVKNGKPLVGICLGMQLLGTYSDEFGGSHGLNLLPGSVERLQSEQSHIGWNYVESCGEMKTRLQFCRHFYFNHSFHLKVPDRYVIGVTDCEGSVVSAVARDNIVGFQFHPEKSQLAGKLILKQALDDLLHA